MTPLRERTFVATTARCNLCGCELKRRENCRGCCRKDYQNVWRLIYIKKKFTEEQVVAVGIWNPKETVEDEIYRRIEAASRAG